MTPVPPSSEPSPRPQVLPDLYANGEPTQAPPGFPYIPSPLPPYKASTPEERIRTRSSGARHTTISSMLTARTLLRTGMICVVFNRTCISSFIATLPLTPLQQ
jgi:hypothetical protein